jgi:zinc transporter
VTQEELDSQTNINISRTMYLMSLVMLIFTPLTFVTGLLGANIGGIPFNDSPYGFAFICVILLCMVAFQFYLIKRIKWF